MTDDEPRDKTPEEVAAEEVASAAAAAADNVLDAELEAEATDEGMPAAEGDDTDSGDVAAEATEYLEAVASGDKAVELLADLKRVSAEFKNYRRNSEERIELERRRAKADAAKLFLGVLDDLNLAEKHGDLPEGSAFATIAQKMHGLASDLGVVSFGAQGDGFDPNIHDAVFQQPNPDVEAPTVAEVVSVGYTLDDVLVRPAKVVVWLPE